MENKNKTSQVTVTANTTADDLRAYIDKILSFHGMLEVKTDKGIPLKDVVFGTLRETLVKDEKARQADSHH